MKSILNHIVKALLIVVPFFFHSVFGKDTLCFTTTDTIGCAPYTVTVNNCASEGIDVVSYAYDSENSILTTLSDTYTYTEPGSYVIAQIGDIGEGSLDTFFFETKIEVLSTTLPDVALNACQNNVLNVEIETGAFDEYEIDFGDGDTETFSNSVSIEHSYSDSLLKTISLKATHIGHCSDSASFDFQPFTSLDTTYIKEITQNSETSFTIDVQGHGYYKTKLRYGLPLDSIELLLNSNSQTVSIDFQQSSSTGYTFQTQSYDVCGNFINSKEVQSIPLSISSLDNHISLSWSNYNDSISVNRNNAFFIVTNGSNYSDSAITCQTEYCYRVSAHERGTKTTSQERCENAFSSNKPPSVERIDIDLNKGDFELKIDSSIQYNELYLNLSSTLENSQVTLTNSILSYSEAYSDDEGLKCVELYYIDLCGNTSDSSSACPILLTWEDISTKTDITFTPYEGIDSLRYELLVLSKDDTVTYPLSGTSFSFINLEIPQSGNVTVRGLYDSTEYVYSNTLTFENNNYIFVPNAIRPNGDLGNLFYPVGEFIETYQIRIFNDFGALVTDLEENTPWNGIVQGETTPETSYLYFIEITDQEGVTIVKKGIVTVLH